MASRFLAFVAAATLCSSPVLGQALAGAARGQAFQLDRVPARVAFDVLLRRVSDSAFVLCDAVLKDDRLVSLRLDPAQLNAASVAGVLRTYGYFVRVSGGVRYVCDERSALGAADAGRGDRSLPVPATGGGIVEPRDSQRPTRWADAPSGAPVEAEADQGAAQSVQADRERGNAPPERASAARVLDSQLLGVRPDYIEPEALIAIAEPLFPEVRFSVARGKGQRPGVFAQGPIELVDRFANLAKFVDRPPEGVQVEAIVLEVTRGDRSGWGVSFVLDQLRDGLGLSIGGEQQDQSLTFRAGSFDAVLSAVASSSGVRVLSSPRLRGRSGETLRLQVGQDVPTLGAVVENPLGSTAQTINYRSSGVIFEVLADVLGKRIGLSVHQELSDFGPTVTGVQGSPTLSTRRLDTVLDLESGEWAVIGGLTASQENRTRESLFGLVPLGRNRELRESELVLLVNVRRAGLASDADSRSEFAALERSGGTDAAAHN